MSTEVISDRNIAGRASATVSRQRPYSDLDLSLTLHPDFHDIIPLTDIDAVKAAATNLVLSNFFDRPFQPFLASNLRGTLFEPADKFTMITIKEQIKRVLSKYEPRIDSLTVQVQDDSDANRYVVTVGFRVIAISQSVTVSIYLERVR